MCAAGVALKADRKPTFAVKPGNIRALFGRAPAKRDPPQLPSAPAEVVILDDDYFKDAPQAQTVPRIKDAQQVELLKASESRTALRPARSSIKAPSASAEVALLDDSDSKEVPQVKAEPEDREVVGVE